jgi:hypothetical protein
LLHQVNHSQTLLPFLNVEMGPIGMEQDVDVRILLLNLIIDDHLVLSTRNTAGSSILNLGTVNEWGSLMTIMFWISF